MTFYSKEAIDEIANKWIELDERVPALTSDYITYEYNTDKGLEYGRHGFARRLQTVARCIDKAFSAIPADIDHFPTKTQRADVTIYVQAFVVNIVGCLDNLAWVWNYEKHLQLGRHKVVLNGAYMNLPKNMAELIASYKDWFAYIKDYRDALSHRIPIYIPPFVFVESHSDEYRRIQDERKAAILKRDLEKLNALDRREEAISMFKPIALHSIVESPGILGFHQQMLRDFLTIEQLGLYMLEALAVEGSS